MLQTKIITGCVSSCQDVSLEDRINVTIEKFERERLRVRDLQVLPLGRDGQFIAVIKYDNSVYYQEKPIEIDDAYHRKAVEETPCSFPFMDVAEEHEEKAYE